jgi:regulatory protein
MKNRTMYSYRNCQNHKKNENREYSKTTKTTREYALAMLERSDRTEQQIRQKLQEKECPADEIDETVAFLKEYHYIDDAEYARRYVRASSSRKSRRRIRSDLEQRGVARTLIAEALEEQPVDEESQIRSILIKKKFQPDERMEPDEYRRLMNALARKGFSYDNIHRVMGRMCEDA